MAISIDDLKKWNEAINKVIDNPMVDHAIDWAGDYLMGHHFWKKVQQPDGTYKRVVNEDWLKTEAPHLFAETALDENVLREITYSKYLKSGWRVALFDNWGPPLNPLPLFADPIPSLGQIGPNQWNDFRIKLVSEMFKKDGTPLEGTDRDKKIQELCATLTEIAKLDNPGKLRRLIRLNYCRALESQYRIVQIQRWRGRAFNGLGDFMSSVLTWVRTDFATWVRVDLTNWMENTGAPGFLNGATVAAAAIDTFTGFLTGWGTQMNAALGRATEKQRPKGLGRWMK